MSDKVYIFTEVGSRMSVSYILHTLLDLVIFTEVGSRVSVSYILQALLDFELGVGLKGIKGLKGRIKLGVTSNF